MEDGVLFYGHLVYTAICLFCVHSVYFVVIWYIFSRSGTFCREKSGNPDLNSNYGANSFHWKASIAFSFANVGGGGEK
jgi:ABC-type uncharacterized transport system permease subunit